MFNFRHIAICLLLLLCSSAAIAKDVVVLQLPWDHQFQFAGYYAADIKGFYAAADLDVRIKSSITADKKFIEPPVEVLAGRADFGIGSGDIILANETDNRLRVIASIFQSSATRFYVKQDKPFTSLAELVEKCTIARRLGSFVDVELQAMLRSEGIDPAKVKTVKTLPGVAHFVDGRADLVGGYSLSFPYEIKKHSIAVTEINPQNYGINFYGDAVFTSKKLIDENPELVEKFLAATLKGWRYALENPDEMVDYIASSLPRTHPVDDVRRYNQFQAENINKHTSYPIVEPGHINPYRWQKMHEALREAGMISSSFAPDQLIWSPAKQREQASQKMHKIGALLLAGSLVTALILFGFILLLRKLVRERTASLLQANQTALHRQAEFESVFHSITDAIVLVNPQRQIIRTNSAFTALFGYQLNEIKGQTTERLYATPENFKEQGRQRYNADSLAESPIYTMQYRRKDGAAFTGETLGVTVKTVKGEQIGYLAVIRDITQRLESEKRIRELSRFPDENPGPVLRVDDNAVISYANQASAALLDEWATGVGQTLPETLVKALRNACAKQQNQSVELSCAERQFTFVIAPIASEDYVNLYGQDITESKRLEEQLHQSEKMQAIGQLAGGVAHDFNNQLGVILGSVELLGNKLEDRSLQRYLDNIKAGASRAAELTKNLLAFSRKGKYLSRPLDLHAIISEVIVLLEHSIDKRISIRKRLHQGKSFIIGDPTLLQNAILNLALNARDAMPEGGEISIETDVIYLGAEECGRFSEPLSRGEYLQLSVCDTGRGMDEETQKHMFEPFFTTKAEGRGTGLGLASVYGTVRNHSGTIQVESHPGQGTEIKLYFPLAATAQPADDKLLPVEPRAGVGNLLVVDDERDFRDMLAETLTQLGYSVTTCKNGKEALARYRDSQKIYDLVILDMIMPELNGRDTFLALRQINPDVQVILSSGFSNEGDIQNLLDLGVAAFIGKPFKQQELAEQVAACTAHRQHSAEAP
ncbi:MAG TPA: ABC transporter substrate-binding protein [Malonomonas sp.]